MSQVFSGDSVTGAAGITVTTTTETPGATGNFLNPPFGNCKGMVFGTVLLTPGTGTTAVVVRLRRNPNAENVNIMGSGALTVTAGNSYQFSLQGADPIPDGRPVQYAVTVSQTGATGNGTITQANISAFLISG